MELKHYLQIAVRWAWLLILGAALGAAGGYYYSKGQQPVYQASTRAMLMRAPLEQSSDLTYYSDLQLVQTYLQLMTTQPVLDKASERLGYKISKGQIKVKQNQDTQIMDLTVEDSDPQHAADIANVLVQVLIEHNTNLQSGRYLATEESLKAQIEAVETQIKSIQSDVDQISTQSFQDQLAQTQAQIAPLQAEVSTLQQEIAALNYAEDHPGPAHPDRREAGARRPDQAAAGPVPADLFQPGRAGQAGGCRLRAKLADDPAPVHPGPVPAALSQPA